MNKGELLNVAMLFSVWLVSAMVTYGKKLILLPPRGGVFKVGARIDVTFIGHLVGLYLACYIHPWLFAVPSGILLELKDGFLSGQGADLVDLAMNAVGIWLWFELSSHYKLITFV